MKAVLSLVSATTLLVGMGSTTAMASPSTGVRAADAELTAVQSVTPQSKNNRPRRAGAPVRWVQHPYLKKAGNGRLAVTAKVYVDPFKGKKPARYARKAATDRLHVKVAVAKKKYAKVGKPRAVGMLTGSDLSFKTTYKLSLRKRGMVDVSVPLAKKVSKRLKGMGFRQRSAAISIVAIHHKDTLLGVSKWGLKQVVPIELTSGKFSKRTLDKYTRTAKKQVAYVRSGKLKGGSSDRKLQWNGNTPFYNYVNVQNWSPFAQSVAVNPNIQCMWTGATPNSNQQSANTTTLPGGTAQFVYEASSSESNWPGMNGATDNLNAPGTQGGLMADLSKAAKATETNVVASLENPATYSESGAATAAASAGLTFLGTFIGGLFDTSTCNDVSTYPELFGVSSQVIGFGTNNVNTASSGDYPTSNLWNGQGAVEAGSVEGPASVPSSSWASANLQPMLGAQTVVTYYWNGGQPAPMVSNNASGSGYPSGYTGGSANYQGGLFQFVGVNPGSPGSDDDCTYGSNNTESCNYDPAGSMNIQLQFLSNPNGTMGLWNQGGTTPQLTVTEDSSGDYYLSCDLSGLDVTLSLPFGYNGGQTNPQSASLMENPINGSGQLPINGNWLVSFYGIADVNGTDQYVYYGDSWQTQPVSAATGYTVPELSPNATSSPVTFQAASGGGSQATVEGTVYASDLDGLYTADGTPVDSSDITAFGCNAVPSVQLPGLSIIEPAGSTIADSFGAIDPSTNTGWPMPGNHTGWPTSSFTPYDYDTNWEWQWPVNQLNLSFQGMPTGEAVAVSVG